MKCPRFFVPLPSFIPFMKGLIATKKRPIVDCGCGEGDLVFEMNREGLPAIGVDNRFEILGTSPDFEVLGRIMAMPAEECPLVKSTECILLVCRPCHNQFPALINEARHKDSEFFYIGFEKNIDFDLAGAPVNLALQEPVGEDGEMIWGVGRKSLKTHHKRLSSRLLVEQ